MDQKALKFYRDILADLNVDHEEASTFRNFLSTLNPPPDKLVWLRANAFKVGCEFLSETREQNLALLRALNFLVHAIETTCMEPKILKKTVPYNENVLTDYYKDLLQDHVIDDEENTGVYSFFQNTHPPGADNLTQTRALIFKVACEYLADDRETNVKILRCVNVIVHIFEAVCMQPKQYNLVLPETVNLKMSLSEAVQHLWNLDLNRLTPNEDYTINVQSGKKPFWKEDAAPDPLFTRVDNSVWKRPTYKAFVPLLDNYFVHVGEAEVLTTEQQKEIEDFLFVIMQTAPMQFCHKYCHAQNPSLVSKDPLEFRKLLRKIWFDLYRRERNGHLDSSGFEHVFVGEARDGQVTGFHNWIQFYLEEKHGKVDYRGYLKPKCKSFATANSDDHLLTLQFSWGGIEKFAGTFFVGTSPEFEMAVYSMCFLVGGEDNEVEINTGTDVFGVNIKCYRMARDKIGTAYPEVTSHFES